MRTQGFTKTLKGLTNARVARDGSDAMDENVVKVEVKWRGRVEWLSFRRPEEAAFLSAAAKERFELAVWFIRGASGGGGGGGGGTRPGGGPQEGEKKNKKGGG